jgi:uncharacterized protein DUF4136
MTRNLPLAAYVALATFLILTTLVEAKVKVNTKKDDAFDFRAVRTWAWHPDGAGEVKMMLTPDDNPAAMQARFEPVIKAAVEDQMRARQLTAVPAGGKADLYVYYYVLISTSTNRSVIGQNVTAEMAWAVPMFAQSTQGFEIFEEGSLVLDVSNPATRSLVWRGVAQAKIDRERKPAERDARLREAIADLLGKFPKS